MPRVRNGKITSGNLGPSIFVAGHRIYGGTAWLSDDETVNQVCPPGPCTVQARNVHTGRSRILAHRESSRTIAAAGFYAGWNPTDFAFTNDPNRTGYDLVGDIGPDGAFAVKLGPAGPWVVVERDRSTWLLTDGDLADVQLLGKGRAQWLDYARPGRTHVIGVPQPRFVNGDEGAGWHRMRNVKGVWWSLYQAAGRLWLQPTEHPGMAIDITGGDTFWTDLGALKDGRLRAVWAVGASAAQSEVRVFDYPAKGEKLPDPDKFSGA